jgi:16S rRNA (uracil1498-N3)-methyltransferase
MSVNTHTSPRLFVEGALAEDVTVPVSQAQARHLGAVLRLRAGADVRVFNGRDGEWLAIYPGGHEATALPVRLLLRPQVAEPDCWLVFAVLRREATEVIVEKATELGVSLLQPVLTERAQSSRLNGARLAAIARAAAEQCERLTLPRIAPLRRLPDLLATWPAERTLFAAIERRAAPAPVESDASKALLVGPEGGFTQAELELLDRHPFVRAVSLGPRVLRAETAAIAGLALLQMARAPEKTRPLPAALPPAGRLGE